MSQALCSLSVSPTRPGIFLAQGLPWKGPERMRGIPKGPCEAPSMNIPVPRDPPLVDPDETDSGLLTLRDGSTVQVRTAGPEDRDALGDFFRRLSPASRRRRFSSLSSPRPELIASLCDSSDPRSGLTLVATRTPTPPSPTPWPQPASLVGPTSEAACGHGVEQGLPGGVSRIIA